MLPLAMLQLTSIPLTFVLGFYVSLIVTRWGWLDVRILSLIILVGRPVDSDLLGGGTSTVSFPGQTRWQYTPWGSLSERSLSSYLSLFQSIYPDPGGAPEVDEAEHCEVQPALLLHVHEDRQLQGEEEVSRPSGISHSTAKRPSYLNWYLIGSTSLTPDWWGMMNWKCFRTLTPRFLSRYNHCKNYDLKAANQVSANKWFLPLVWATDICARALAEGHIRPQVMMLFDHH